MGRLQVICTKRHDDQNCRPWCPTGVCEESIAENSEFGSSTSSFQWRTSDNWTSNDVCQTFPFE